MSKEKRRGEKRRGEQRKAAAGQQIDRQELDINKTETHEGMNTVSHLSVSQTMDKDSHFPTYTTGGKRHVSIQTYTVPFHSEARTRRQLSCCWQPHHKQEKNRVVRAPLRELHHGAHHRPPLDGTQTTLDGLFINRLLLTYPLPSRALLLPPANDAGMDQSTVTCYLFTQTREIYRPEL